MENKKHTGEDSAAESANPDFTPEEKLISRQLLRARTRLLVVLGTLPVYIVAIWVLLNNRHEIETIMYIYMALWAAFAVDMARRLCPQCHNQFFVKVILMSLRARRCVHCGFDAARAQQKNRDNEVTF